MKAPLSDYNALLDPRTGAATGMVHLAHVIRCVAIVHHQRNKLSCLSGCPQVKGRPKVCSFCGQEGHNQRSCYARCEAEASL